MFYVFGGLKDNLEYSNIVAKFDEAAMDWSVAGNLRVGREAHNVIYDGSEFLVVGGKISADFIQTEKFYLSNETMACSLQNPSLSYYSTYPELFPVHTQFCKN